VTVELVFQVFTEFSTLAFNLLAIREREEVRSVIKEFLPLSFFFILFLYALSDIVTYKLITFTHKQLILSAFLPCDLLSDTLQELLLLLFLSHKIPLSSDHFVLYISEVLLTYLAYPLHLAIEIYPFPKPLMHPIIPHPREPSYSDPISSICFDHLSICQAGIGNVARLWIWI